MAVPIALRHEEPSQPILPPRPTGRMQASGTRSARWTSWPIVVIAIAVVAIITAVILMVWPPGGPSNADAKTLAPPPAPERMDTNPLPPSGGAQGGLDPWSKPGAVPDPAPVQPPDPPTAPDIDDIPDPGNLRDPFSGLGGNGFGSSNMMGLLGQALGRACDKLASCPNASSTARMMCDATRMSLPRTAAPSCAAAQRCLAHLDRVLTCDDDLDPSAVLGLLTGVDDCSEALRC